MRPIVHLYSINYNLRIDLNIMSVTQIYHKIKTTFLNTHVEKVRLFYWLNMIKQGERPRPCIVQTFCLLGVSNQKKVA